MGRRGEKPESKKKGTSLLSIVIAKLSAWDKALDKQFNKLTVDTLAKLPLSYYSIAIVCLSVLVFMNVNGYVPGADTNSAFIQTVVKLSYLLVAVLAGLRAMVGLLQNAKPLAFLYWTSLALTCLFGALVTGYSVWWNIAPVLQQTVMLPLLSSRGWEDLKSNRRS